MRAARVIAARTGALLVSGRTFRDEPAVFRGQLGDHVEPLLGVNRLGQRREHRSDMLEYHVHLAAGQTLGQRLQHRLGRALRDVGRQVGGLPPDGLDDLLLLHSRSLRPAPARPYPPSR